MIEQLCRGDVLVNRSGNDYIVDTVVYLDPEVAVEEKKRPKHPGLESQPRKSYFTIYSERAQQTLNGRYNEEALMTGLLTPTGRKVDIDGILAIESGRRASERAVRKEQTDAAKRVLASYDSGGTNPDPVDPTSKDAAVPKVAKAPKPAVNEAPVPPDCADCATIWAEAGGECKLCHYVPKVSKFTPLTTLIRLHSAKHHRKEHKA